MMRCFAELAVVWELYLKKRNRSLFLIDDDMEAQEQTDIKGGYITVQQTYFTYSR